VSVTFLETLQGADFDGGEGSPPQMDHLGIAVRSIEAARVFYEALGLRVSAIETVEHEGVRVAMLGLGASRLELLEPLTPESVIGRFLERRGEGLHHVAMRVAEIDVTFRKLLANGVRLASEAVRVGAGGHRYFFVHPSSANGVLVEVVGEASVAAKKDGLEVVR
jgi:methylmalonyl-CoA epimerase